MVGGSGQVSRPNTGSCYCISLLIGNLISPIDDSRGDVKKSLLAPAYKAQVADANCQTLTVHTHITLSNEGFTLTDQEERKLGVLLAYTHHSPTLRKYHGACVHAVKIIYTAPNAVSIHPSHAPFKPKKYVLQCQLIIHSTTGINMLCHFAWTSNAAQCIDVRRDRIHSAKD